MTEGVPSPSSAPRTVDGRHVSTTRAIEAGSAVKAKEARWLSVTHCCRQRPMLIALRNFYSITSSARSKIDCGTVRPSAYALLEIYDDLKFDRQLNWQVGRLCATENAIHIGCRAAIVVQPFGSAGQQTTFSDIHLSRGAIRPPKAERPSVGAISSLLPRGPFL
jgi:hypothetical protein